MTGSTMPSTNGWDDTRLETAFLERSHATAPTPPDLVDTIHDRIAAAPRADRALLAWRLAPALGLAATVVLAIIIGVGQLGLVGPVASARPATPTTSALIGSPLTIPQAIAIRDGGVDDREIAVTGFLGSATQRHCPMIRIPANPTRLDCPPASTWLMENRESLMTSSGGTITVHGPKGPAIQPSFQLVSLPPVGVDESSPPAWPVVTVIGHFDDRRANLCEPGPVSACRDTFVVDRIATVGALEQPVTTLLANTRYDEATSSVVALPPTTLEANLDRAVAAAYPEVAVLSRQLLTGDRLGGAEPALRDDAAWTGQRLVWIVTAVGRRDGRPVARTFLLADGTTSLVEMTANGPSTTASTSALGLPILSVAEALAVRDGVSSDREIAVRGWFSPALPLPCPAPPRSVNPVRLQCPFGSQWLLDTPEPLAAGQSTPRSGRAGFQALLPFLDLTALTAAARPATTEARLPEVILIGHFRDRRGHRALCDVPDPTACAGFVADGIFSIDGVRAASSTVVDMEPWEPELRREPTWTPADVDRLFQAALPSLEILSRVALPGHRVSELEPALGTGMLGIINRDVVWSVTGLDADIDGRPVRRTFLVVDGTAEAYESAPWEVSNIGFVPFALVPRPTAPSPVVASPEPDADPFAGVPTSVSGIDVGFSNDHRSQPAT